MSEALVEKGPWDKPNPYAMSRDEMMDIVAKADSCVFIRLRSDGPSSLDCGAHPNLAIPWMIEP